MTAQNNKLGIVVAGLLLGILMASMDNTIVATAMGTIVGELGGLFGAVFGMSSIFGPLLGAYITDHINWHWVFYINLPLGIVAFIFVAFFYRESHEHSKQKIDWWGALTLVGAVVSLMFALELGGKEYAWNSATIIGLFAAFAVLTFTFLLVETRAAEPIISFNMFTKRLYATSNATAIFSGAAFITASVYIPIFIQGVLGGSATNSGLVLLPMMLGSVVTATAGGFLMNKISYRAIMIPASVILALGTVLLTTLSPDTSRLIVTLDMIVVGLGIGASFSVLSNAAIHSFDARQRGSASSTLNFLRSMGMTLGITVFGIIQSHAFAKKLSSALGGNGPMPQGAQTSDPHTLLDPIKRNLIPKPVLDKITDALSSSIVYTFAWTIVPAILALVFGIAMSKEKLDPTLQANASSASH